MARMAYSAATLPLRRRLLGSLTVIAGVLVVCVGFFVTVTNAPAAPGGQTVTLGSHTLPVGSGAGTAADSLRHLADHGLPTGSLVGTVADLLYRGGVAAMAAAALLALVLLLTPVRGLIGLAAGVGFLGVAMVAAVTAGQSASLSTANPTLVHAGVGPGVAVLAGGFLVILAGGALAALRPLAGLVTGIGLAVLAAVAGVVVALVVGGSSIAGALPR